MTIEQALILAVVCSLSVGGLVLFLTYRHWYVPLYARRKAERLRREEAAGIPPSPRDYHYAVSFDSEGFTINDLREHEHQPVGMRWAEVSRGIVFKRDLFAVDCICLFLARDDGSGLELDEEMARWNSLMEALPKYLPGCKPWSEWFSVVAFPAFVPNETEIYIRGTPQIAQPAAPVNVHHAPTARLVVADFSVRPKSCAPRSHPAK